MVGFMRNPVRAVVQPLTQFDGNWNARHARKEVRICPPQPHNTGRYS